MDALGLALWHQQQKCITVFVVITVYKSTKSNTWQKWRRVGPWSPSLAQISKKRDFYLFCVLLCHRYCIAQVTADFPASSLKDLEPSLRSNVKESIEHRVMCLWVRRTLTTDGEVEAAQPVSWQGVSATLQNHCTGLVHLHHLGHHLHTHVQTHPSTCGHEHSLNSLASAIIPKN